MLFSGVVSGLTGLKKAADLEETLGNNSGGTLAYYGTNNPGQKFTAPNDSVLVSWEFSNYLQNSGTIRYELYKDGTKLTETDAFDVATAVQKADFQEEIQLVGGDVYEVRIKNVSNNNQKGFYYNTSDVFAGGTRTNNGSDQTGDMVFKAYYKDIVDIDIADPVYLGDDGNASGFKGTNEVLLGYMINSDSIIYDFSEEEADKTVSQLFTSHGVVGTNTVTYNHTLGKKPKEIRLIARNKYYHSDGIFIEHDNSNRCTGIEYNNGEISSNDVSVRMLFSNSSGNYLQGKVVEVTDTTFSIEWYLGTTSGYNNMNILAILK